MVLRIFLLRYSYYMSVSSSLISLALLKFCEDYNLWSCSLLNSLNLPVSSSLHDLSVSSAFCILVGHENKFHIHTHHKGEDSAVGIASSYGMDDWAVRARVPVGARIFFSARRPDRLWGPPSFLSNGYRGSISEGKAAGAWSWPLIFN
jgi:hypothetical protein